MADTPGDYVKLVVIALAVVAAVEMFTVQSLHLKAWRNAPSKLDGVMPRHVTLVSASYGILTVGIALGLYESVFGPIGFISQTVRVYMYGFAFVLAIWALYIVGGLQIRRIKFLRPKERTDGK